MLCVSCYMVLCGASWVAQLVKNLHAMKETPVQLLGWEDPLEESMATDSSILAWKISWTEEPGILQSIGLQRVGHDRETEHACTVVVIKDARANKHMKRCSTLLIIR